MEVWKDIEGYEGLYQVSNLGNVKSLDRWISHKGSKQFVKGIILKPGKNEKGYLHVILYKNGRGKMHRVHRLVAQAFIPNDDPERKPQINHIREFEKTNNSVDNLEWCNAKYNNNYGTRIEKTSKKVFQYSLDGEFLAEYPSSIEVERQTGYSQGNISKCCLGKRKTAYGYIWRYAS